MCLFMQHVSCLQGLQALLQRSKLGPTCRCAMALKPSKAHAAFLHTVLCK